MPVDDGIPIELGYYYLLVPGTPSDDWVQVYAIDQRYAYMRGVGTHKTDVKRLLVQFSDNVKEWKSGSL